MMKIGKNTIEITNPAKVMFPAAGITKEDLATYYRNIAGVMLKHIRGRPLTIHRFPDGIDGKNFIQKEKSRYFPEWMDSVSVKKTNGTIEMPVAGNAADLAYLANQASIALHIWLSRGEDLYRPDKMIIDLDPPGGDFESVKKAAGKIRRLFEDIDLPCFLMATGSKGLHIAAPLSGKEDFDASKTFAKKVCDFFAARHPDEFTSEIRKEKRKGRIYLDYLRNAYAQTGIAPYSLRPIEHAPVAAPLSWDELDDKSILAQTFNLKNIFKRLEEKGDPWANFYRYGKSLKEPDRKLSNLLDEMAVKS